MLDTRVTCVAKNYKVDEKVKELMFTDIYKKSTLEIDAPPLDQQVPIYLPLNAIGKLKL